eukprot:9185359-Pyramimonas_sp.AAC.1
MCSFCSGRAENSPSPSPLPHSDGWCVFPISKGWGHVSPYPKDGRLVIIPNATTLTTHPSLLLLSSCSAMLCYSLCPKNGAVAPHIQKDRVRVITPTASPPSFTPPNSSSCS